MLRARASSLPPSPVVLLAVFAAGVDNFVAAPMLLAISEDFERSFAAAAAVVAAYVFTYGILQLAWVYASDRFGRLAVVQTGMALAVVFTAASALAPNVATLIVLRGLAGAAFAAVVPATITYIGDHVPVERRPRTLSDLVAVYAIGSAAGIVCGGFAADLASWRVGFAAAAVVSAVALVTQLRYGRDSAAGRHSFAKFAVSVRTTVGSRWPRTMTLVAMLWGAVLIGFLTFFPAALEDGGASRRTAGLVVALYGIAIAIASRPARRVAGRLPRALSLGLGVLIATGGLVVVALSTAVGAVAVAAVLVAVGFALAHPLLQQWATIVMPTERATAVGLFATSLFVGTAITTQVIGQLVDPIGFSWVFAIGALLGGVLAVVIAVTWTRYERAMRVDGASSSQTGT